MINDIKTLNAALKRDLFCGVILYEGPSVIDGAPIVAIANRIATASNNDKTGAMVQSFILRQDIAPTDAVKSGDDVSVCGDCPLRPIKNGATTCYVKVFQSPLSTWKAYKRDRYARPGIDFDADLLPELFRDKSVRIGSYGDPAAVPRDIWNPYVQYARRWTGYTHQWRNAPSFRNICMASVDHASETQTAIDSGWRYFRVSKSPADISANEVLCPASKQAGQRTNCAACGLCRGYNSHAKNIFIPDHGPRRDRVAFFHIGY